MGHDCKSRKEVLNIYVRTWHCRVLAKLIRRTTVAKDLRLTDLVSAEYTWTKTRIDAVFSPREHWDGGFELLLCKLQSVSGCFRLFNYFLIPVSSIYNDVITLRKGSSYMWASFFFAVSRDVGLTGRVGQNCHCLMLYRKASRFLLYVVELDVQADLIFH